MSDSRLRAHNTLNNPHAVLQGQTRKGLRARERDESLKSLQRDGQRVLRRSALSPPIRITMPCSLVIVVHVLFIVIWIADNGAHGRVHRLLVVDLPQEVHCNTQE